MPRRARWTAPRSQGRRPRRLMARELNDISARLAEADIRVRQPLGQARWRR